MKSSEIQFKFLITIIFSIFLFAFLFGFIANVFITYQQYATVHLYTTILAFLDIVFLKKDTAAVIQITRGSNFNIKFTDNSMIISVFFNRKSFPLYDKIVFSPELDTPQIYYSVKSINLPFYVGSVIYLFPLRDQTLMEKGKQEVIAFTYTKSMNYKDFKGLINLIFPNQNVIDNLPVFYEPLGVFLQKPIGTKNLRLFIYSKDLLDALLSLKKLQNKIIDKQKYWIVIVNPYNEFAFKVYLFNKSLTGKELKKILSAVALGKNVIKEYYIPKDLVLAPLLSNSREDFEKKFKKLIDKVFYSYLAYQQSKEYLNYVGCQYYPEIDKIVEELKKLKEENSKYNYNNITLFLSKEAEKIKKRNDEKEKGDTPICTLY